VVIISALLCIFILSPPFLKSLPDISNGPNHLNLALILEEWTHFVVEHPLLCLGCGLIVMILISIQCVRLKQHTRSGLSSCQTGIEKGIQSLQEWLWSRLAHAAIIVIEKPAEMSEQEYLRGRKSSFRKCGTGDTLTPLVQVISVSIKSRF